MMKGIRRIAGLLSVLMLLTACFGSTGVSLGEKAAISYQAASEAAQADVSGHEYLVFKAVEGGLAVVGCSDSGLKKVEIPSKFNGEPVIYIATGAFKNMEKLEEVTTGKKLLKIREAAFENCPALELIALPDALEKIADKAFVNCPNLTIDAGKGTVGRKYANNNGIPVKGADEPGEVSDAAELTITGDTTVTAGKEITLKAMLGGKKADVKWSSSNKKIATVTKKGVVKGKKVKDVSTVTITAKLKSNKKITATATITVLPLASKVSITSNPADLHNLDLNAGNELGGKTVQLTATLTPAAAAQGVKWKSSDKSIATVSNTGLVTAKKAGKVTITATATDGSKVSAKWKITVSAAVKEITISGADTLLAGKNTTLTAKITPDKATNKKVKWTTSNKNAATVNDSGKVKAQDVKEITVVTITATSAENPNIFATKQITIIPLVKKVTITAERDYINLNGEKTLQLTAVGTPVGSNQSFKWKSSDTSILKVDGNGLVTGKKKGKATITATSTDGGKVKGKFEITVLKSVSGIEISGDATTLYPGKTAQLRATVEGGSEKEKQVIWSSSDAAAATVDANGLVTAKSVSAETEVTITAAAKADPSLTDEYDITIIPYVATVTVTSDDGAIVDLGGDKTLQLSAECAPEDAGQNVTWTSGNTAIATVDGNGLVTGIAPGTAVITATATDGSNISGSFTVTVKYLISDINIAGGDERTLISGANVKLTVTATPADADASVTWASSNTAVATVAADGTVTAMSVGVTSQATITATSAANPDLKAECDITVIPKATGVTLNSTAAKLSLNDDTRTLQLDVTVTPADAEDSGVTWTSSDVTVATVNAAGLVTAVKAGTAVITASVQDKSATCQITVAATSEPTEVKIAGPNAVYAKKTIILTASVLPATALQNITWSTSNAAIATVDALGVVTGVAPGTATITATAAGTQVRGSITVTVNYYPDSVTIAPAEAVAIVAGGSVTLTAGVLPAGDVVGVNWTSLDTAKASVSNTGVVTASASITAPTDVVIRAAWKTDGAVYADKSIRIIPQLSALNIPASGAIDLAAENKTFQIIHSVTPAGADGLGVIYSSDNAAVATVSGTGLVTGLSVGTANISVTVQGVTKTCAITVIQTVVTVSGPTEMYSGTQITLASAIAPVPADSTVTWSSSNDAVATVSAGGVVTAGAVSANTKVIITATMAGEPKAKGTYEINVKPLLPSLVIKGDSIRCVNFAVEAEKQFTLEIEASAAAIPGNIEWSSANTSIAEVDQNGNVTVKAVGSVVISVAAKDGSCLGDSVTVTAESVVGVDYTVEEGVVTITGDDAATGAVTLPDTLFGIEVTAIAEGAFQGNENITSIKIPAKVTVIPANAFEGCTELTSVTIPNGVTSISEAAFKNCTKLSTMTTY